MLAALKTRPWITNYLLEHNTHAGWTARHWYHHRPLQYLLRLRKGDLNNCQMKLEMLKQSRWDILSLPFNKFIFLFDFTENPDGMLSTCGPLASGTRSKPGRQLPDSNPWSSHGYPTINKWNRSLSTTYTVLSKNFLIRTCKRHPWSELWYTIFSVDLIQKMPAHHMGRAGVANSKYNSYIIPKTGIGAMAGMTFSGYTGFMLCLPWNLRPYHWNTRIQPRIPISRPQCCPRRITDFLNQDPDRLLGCVSNFYRAVSIKPKIQMPKMNWSSPKWEIVDVWKRSSEILPQTTMRHPNEPRQRQRCPR